MGKNVFISEIKREVVRAKFEGKLTTREIMGIYNITNKSQVEAWMRWYKKGEVYRFDQPIGKQYSYGHGIRICE